MVSALTPVGFEPTVCRLYAEMHYDHTDNLMAMTLMSVCVPFLTFAIAAGLGRWTTTQAPAVGWSKASS